jgi:hypothetical protein
MIALYLALKSANAQDMEYLPDEADCLDNLPCKHTLANTSGPGLVVTGVVREVLERSHDPLHLINDSFNWMLIEVTENIHGSVASGWVLVAPTDFSQGHHHCAPGSRILVSASLIYPVACPNSERTCDHAALGDVVESRFEDLICEAPNGALMDVRYVDVFGNKVCFGDGIVRHERGRYDDAVGCPEGSRGNFDDLVAAVRAYPRSENSTTAHLPGALPPVGPQ